MDKNINIHDNIELSKQNATQSLRDLIITDIQASQRSKAAIKEAATLRILENMKSMSINQQLEFFNKIDTMSNIEESLKLLDRLENK